MKSRNRVTWPCPRLRVVPLSLSLSSETRKKPVRKMAASRPQDLPAAFFFNRKLFQLFRLRSFASLYLEFPVVFGTVGLSTSDMLLNFYFKNGLAMIFLRATEAVKKVLTQKVIEWIRISYIYMTITGSITTIFIGSELFLHAWKIFRHITSWLVCVGFHVIDVTKIAMTRCLTFADCRLHLGQKSDLVSLNFSQVSLNSNLVGLFTVSFREWK